MKMLFLYFSAILFLLFGLFLIRTGIKKESIKSVLMKVTHAPTKNYGKLFLNSLPNCQKSYITIDKLYSTMAKFYKETYHLVK